MLELSMTGDLTSIIQVLDGWAHVDLRPLAEGIRTILIEDNATSRAAGLDADGASIESYAPLRGGRPLTPREVRRRGGDGPPLAPSGEGSRVVTAFEVETIPVADDAVLVLGSWPSFPELDYHTRGAGRNPVRDVVGVTPAASVRIGEAADLFIFQTFGAD